VKRKSLSLSHFSLFLFDKSLAIGMGVDNHCKAKLKGCIWEDETSFSKLKFQNFSPLSYSLSRVKL
jgi:hypothetical protein